MITLTPEPLSLEYGEGSKSRNLVPFSLLKGEGLGMRVV